MTALGREMRARSASYRLSSAANTQGQHTHPPSPTMITTLTSLVGGIELLAELTAAGVALMALDRLAAAIRFTYTAGRFTGRMWFTYGVPAVLATADFISWLIAQIDWAEARDTLIAFLALLLTGAGYCWQGINWAWAHREQFAELFTYRYEPCPLLTNNA